MARRARYWRVHSDVTQEVNVIEGKKRCAHAVLRRQKSGQLPFLGLFHSSQSMIAQQEEP